MVNGVDGQLTMDLLVYTLVFFSIV